MNKPISNFRIEKYGCFIDLANGQGRIGVNRKSGRILLDEGEGDDRYHGAVLEPDEFIGMDLQGSQVVLRFGDHRSHVLGTTDEPAVGRAWIRQAIEVIRAHPPVPTTLEVETVCEDSAAASRPV